MRSVVGRPHPLSTTGLVALRVSDDALHGFRSHRLRCELRPLPPRPQPRRHRPYELLRCAAPRRGGDARRPRARQRAFPRPGSPLVDFGDPVVPLCRALLIRVREAQHWDRSLVALRRRPGNHDPRQPPAQRAAPCNTVAGSGRCLWRAHVPRASRGHGTLPRRRRPHASGGRGVGPLHPARSGGERPPRPDREQFRAYGPNDPGRFPGHPPRAPPAAERGPPCLPVRGPGLRPRLCPLVPGSDRTIKNHRLCCAVGCPHPGGGRRYCVLGEPVTFRLLLASLLVLGGISLVFLARPGGLGVEPARTTRAPA